MRRREKGRGGDEELSEKRRKRVVRMRVEKGVTVRAVLALS